MNIIFDLVRKLVLLSIFAAFCELLLPKSSFRAYTRLVVGLLVIAMVLQPIMELRGASFNLQDFLGAEGPFADSSLPEGSWLQEQAQVLVEAQLTEEVGSFLAQTYPHHEVEVVLDVVFDNYGNILEFRKMMVCLRPPSQGIEPVRPVNIGEGAGEGNGESAEPGTINALAHKLGIPADTLSIWIYTGGGGENAH